MEHPVGLDEQKVVDQRTVAQHGLRANSGLIGTKILKRETGAVLLALFEIAALP